MGKRKSSKPQAKKAKQVLDTTFTCLFCNHEDAVTCTMDKRMGIGSLRCKVCGQNYRSAINTLSDPIDVYSDWFDACENVKANKDAASDGGEEDDEDVRDKSDEED